MVDFLGFLASIGERLPGVRKPAPRPTLYRRLMLTGVILTLYFIMANIPLYGIPRQQAGGQFELLRIIFASSAGTLMELGIGPIVTAGLILQILVGAKIIDLDLTKPEARKKFTGAQKALTVFFAIFEGSAFVIGKRYWAGTGMEPSIFIMFIVTLQLVIGALLVVLFDEVIQKGWGIGSAVSLFILAGVAQSVVWSFFGAIPGVLETYGLIPALVRERSAILLARPNAYPDITGAMATVAMILFLAYVQAMKVEIPVAAPRFRGIRSRVPLQFIYVTNIPILLTGILVSNFQLIGGILRDFLGPTHTFYQYYSSFLHYVTPPRGIVEASLDPVKTTTFAISWTIMSIAFGLIWVEIAGLNPREQARKLVEGGLEIPGVRRNPKAVEEMLSQYVYPLTILSSILVAAIVIVADVFGAYGTGTGLLLAVGIINQYYVMIARERALEAYPLLKRILGEE